MSGQTPILRRITERIIPSANDKPCQGHRLKYYLKGMCGRHVSDCLNTGGCSHDCRGCSNIRRSRLDSEYRVRESMIRHATTKMNKAQGEDKRNELRDRFEKLQAQKTEDSPIEPGIAEEAISNEGAEVGLPKLTEDGEAEDKRYAAKRAVGLDEQAGLHWYQRWEECEGERAERLHFGTHCDIGRHGKLTSAGLAERTEYETETESEAENENSKAVQSRSII